MIKNKINNVFTKFAYICNRHNIKKMSQMQGLRLRQQELISEISKSFVLSGDSNALVNEALKKLGNYHAASSVLVFGIDYDADNTYLAYHWFAGEEPLKLAEVNRLELIKKNFPVNLSDGSVTHVFSCDDVASSPVKDFHALLSVGINAFVCVPLYVESRLWGILFVEQRNSIREWTKNEKEYIYMTANIIAGVIMRNIYDKQRTEALEKAVAANKAKSTFLSNMSHEIRTPMNAILGMTKIGKDTDDVSRKDYAFNRIEDAATHLLGIINDILDLSKIDADMFELSPIEFNFERMLQKAIDIINFRVAEKQIKFSLDLNGDIPCFMIGDDRRLLQVITNLLSNAVKFTPEFGEICLGASLMEEKDGLCQLRIYVKDNGIGISPQQQENLFHAFVQADSSISRKFGGTGLGLVISKRIVELMGGSIEVESEIGKGTLFAFTVKMQCGTKNVVSIFDSSLNLKKLRVLAVDDEKENLDSFKSVFGQININCDVAESGIEACKMIEKNGGYDIYYIDWRMPEMDGMELTRRIKAQKRGKQSVVIMTSAVDWEVIKDEAIKAGVNKYLTKPLFFTSIVECANECLCESDAENKVFKGIGYGEFVGKHILLVEDIEINREIVMSLLDSTGIAIDTAENGIRAVEKFSQNSDKYDLIFMDIQMPEMDGCKATRCIRAMDFDKAKTIPIIAMTANVFKDDIDKFIEIGMNDHIGKPINFEIILSKLRKYLKSEN